MIVPWRFLMFGLIAIGAYFLYLSPKVNLISSLKHDNTLHKHIELLEKAEEYDKRSITKMKTHLQNFFIQQSKTYGLDGCDVSIDKLKKQKGKVMKYARRIAFRLPNDGVFERDVHNACDNVEKTLENYLSDAAHRNNLKWPFSN